MWACHGLQALGFAPGADVSLELVPELSNVRLDRPCRRIGEDADCLAFHAAGNRKQVVQVLGTPLSCSDAAHDAAYPAGSLTARRALSAGFVGEEPYRRI